MFELRWLERWVPIGDPAQEQYPVGKRIKILQFRHRINIEELGVQELIWVEWEDVPVEKE